MKYERQKKDKTKQNEKNSVQAEGERRHKGRSQPGTWGRWMQPGRVGGEVMACWCVGDSTVLTAEAGKIGGGQRMNDLICWAKKLEPPFTMNKITVRATSVKLLEENIEESIELHAMDLATISWT